MKSPLFFAKILLFGEYGIIKDSKGLSIPYNFFRGALKLNKFHTDTTRASHEKLLDFAQYLKKKTKIPVVFDWNKIKKDLDKNLYFYSSIL